MGPLVGAFVFPQPPAVTLLTQSVLLLLVRNDGAYCGRPVRGCSWLAGWVFWALQPAMRARALPSRAHPLSSRSPVSHPAAPRPPSARRQLLMHELTRHRAARLAQRLEFSTLPILLLQPFPGYQSAPMAARLREGEPAAVALGLQCHASAHCTGCRHGPSQRILSGLRHRPSVLQAQRRPTQCAAPPWLSRRWHVW